MTDKSAATINLKLDRDLRNKFKLACLKHSNSTMTSMLTKLIADFVEDVNYPLYVENQERRETMRKKLFRDDNTEGYTQAELDALNKEWENKVAELELEENTSDYDEQAKWFCDEVSKR